MVPLLSIIVPAYNEETIISDAVQAIKNVLGNLNVRYEILLIDDGSTDGTWKQVQKAAARSGGEIQGIRFSRNFGKESAILQGLPSVGERQQ